MPWDGIHFILAENNIICLKPDDLKSRRWQWVRMNTVGLMGPGPQQDALGTDATGFSRPSLVGPKQSKPSWTMIQF